MNAAAQLANEVGTTRACAAIGVAPATFYRHRRVADHPCQAKPRPTPPRALSAEERRAVLDTLHSERFVDQAPAEVYATLLDEDRYLCSIRTMYRLLHAAQEVRERRDQLRQWPIDGWQTPPQQRFCLQRGRFHPRGGHQALQWLGR
jgi:putative transposase